MMEKNKDILIVIIATLIFGGASKILVGVPYMAQMWNSHQVIN